MENKVTPTSQNLHEFIYEQGTKVEIDGELLTRIIALSNKVVDEHTDVVFTDRYKFVNTESGKDVKKPKQEDIDSGKVAKVVDLQNTLNSEPKMNRDALALEFIKLVLTLNGEHLKAVEDGKASHISELQAKYKAQMEPLEA